MPKKGTYSICTIDGCDRRMLARGFCMTHYQRQKKAGLIPPLPTTPERFWAKVDKDGPVPDYRPELGRCWLWKPEPAKDTGYGIFAAREIRSKLAHRYSYHLNVGPIPNGLHIDHLCRVRRCVRPTHLEAVTQQENNRREFEAITHCPAGHPYEGDYLYIDKNGGRRCRKCATEKPKAKRNATVIRVRFHGHFPECVGKGDWRCHCGRPLGSKDDEARMVMREVHVPELRAALAAA